MVSVRKLPTETPKTSRTSETLKAKEALKTVKTPETPEASTVEKLSLYSILRRRHFTRLEVVEVQLFEFLLEIIHLYHLLYRIFYLSKERGQNEEQDKDDQKRNLSSAHRETTTAAETKVTHSNSPPCKPKLI
jgi:hypothetical protein